MVWLACWDCKAPHTANQASMVHYAPLAVGYAIFQVFTVDYVAAEILSFDAP